ncbi:MAG: LacI family DNA-binding transcriptional regulator, partial [Clostridia bacterium]|nr:LacI family DNA-binding transcriptional regulator [Clostridia bacterium]
QLPGLRALLQEKGVTGLFCVSDRVAARAIQTLTAHGASVPGDVSVIGFDDCYYDSAVSQPFSSVRQDFRGIGCVAAQTLLEMIDNPSAIPTKRLLGVEAVPRESSLSAPPKVRKEH